MSECGKVQDGAVWVSVWTWWQCFFYGLSVGSMNHDSHIVGWFGVCRWLQHNTIDSHSFLSPVGWIYFAQRIQTPGSRVISYLFEFAASVRDCLTLPSQTTAANTVCSGLSQTRPPTKMISQVHPTTKRTTVSSFLLELKAVLKSLSLLISLWTAAVSATQTEDKSPSSQ